MLKANSKNTGFNILILFASITVIIWGVYQAQSFIVVMLVSIFLSLIGAPIVTWLKSKKIPSAIAVIIIILCMVISILMIGGVIITSLTSFTNNIPLYQQKISEELLRVQDLLNKYGFKINEHSLLSNINPVAVMEFTAGILSGFVSTLSTTILVLLTVAFILLEISSFPVKIRKILGKPNEEFLQFKKFVEDINKYIFIKSVISAVTGILVGLWLYIIGVDYPVLWGFIAFLLNYVPNIGVVISALPAVLLAFIQLGTWHAFLAIIGYAVVNFVIGTIIEPKLVGKSIGLSTLVVFLSLVFWGNLFGVIGMVLCVPFTMAIKFILENNEHTKWIAILLGLENFEYEKHITTNKNNYVKNKKHN